MQLDYCHLKVIYYLKENLYTVSISTDYFTSLLQAEFSRTSSPYREAEEQAYVFFRDFIDDIEC